MNTRPFFSQLLLNDSDFVQKEGAKNIHQNVLVNFALVAPEVLAAIPCVQMSNFVEVSLELMLTCCVTEPPGHCFRVCKKQHHFRGQNCLDVGGSGD